MSTDGFSPRVRLKLWPLGDSRAQWMARRILYHGRSVQCPCCGTSFRRFLPSYDRSDAFCGVCFSQERHRGLQLFLNEWFSRHHRPTRLLHFAPEPCLRPGLERRATVTYLTADFERDGVAARLDLAHLGLRADSMDLIIASHVLEHVTDDRAAATEMRRVLRPGGTALLLVPIDATRASTFEDPALTSPAEREAAYWQGDHVRLYGRDFGDRIAEAGFHVQMSQPSHELSAEKAHYYGLTVDPNLPRVQQLAPPDEIYVATKPT